MIDRSLCVSWCCTCNDSELNMSDALTRFRELACAVTNARYADDGELIESLVDKRDDAWHALTIEERIAVGADDRPDYIKCVGVSGSHLTVCGKRFYPWDLTYIDWAHADENRAREGRLLTCEACEAARAATLPR